MEGNTIPFVVKLKEYIDQRNSKISEKKAVIADLRSQLQSKNGEISKLQEEYKQTFDDKLFEKLIQYKKDVDDIQSNINKISQIVSLMNKGQFEYAPQKIEKEIDSYIEKAKIEELKQAVFTAKKKYIKAFSNYENKLNEIDSVINSMNVLSENISIDTRKYLRDSMMRKYQGKFHYTDEMYDKNNSEIEPILMGIRSLSYDISMGNNLYNIMHDEVQKNHFYDGRWI
jgi:chromosome segregation ATPase